jgi:hypothetical protein
MQYAATTLRIIVNKIPPDKYQAERSPFLAQKPCALSQNRRNNTPVPSGSMSESCDDACTGVAGTFAGRAGGGGGFVPLFDGDTFLLGASLITGPFPGARGCSVDKTIIHPRGSYDGT